MENYLVPSLSSFYILKWIIVIVYLTFLLSGPGSAFLIALGAPAPVSEPTFPTRFAEVLVPVSDVVVPVVFSGPLSVEDFCDLAATVCSVAPSGSHPSVLPCEYHPTFNIQVL